MYQQSRKANARRSIDTEGSTYRHIMNTGTKKAQNGLG